MDTGRGLARDAGLLHAVLESMGHSVTVTRYPPQSDALAELARKWFKLRKRYLPAPVTQRMEAIHRKLRRLGFPLRHTDLVIHLENVHPRNISKRCPNWLIPNQEWFRPERVHYLKDIQSVLCKTRTAQALFEKHHPNTLYLGFSTPAALEPRQCVQKNYQCYLHVAGNSQFKGTRPVINAWKRNPHWPTLTVVANTLDDAGSLPDNIRLKQNITEDELNALWQKAGVVVIPSEVEGYGQVLAEAMVSGAVVVTTDAPPMNELVTAERGYLVPWAGSKPYRLGTRYLVSERDLENTLDEVIHASADTLEAKSRSATTWAQANHDAFQQRLGELIATIPTISPRP